MHSDSQPCIRVACRFFDGVRISELIQTAVDWGGCFGQAGRSVSKNRFVLQTDLDKTGYMFINSIAVRAS